MESGIHFGAGRLVAIDHFRPYRLKAGIHLGANHSVAFDHVFPYLLDVAIEVYPGNQQRYQYDGGWRAVLEKCVCGFHCLSPCVHFLTTK
ncbi:MAG: hypothetical protein OXI17_09665 [Gammaproteobacteria bacterium]|nr:hypothetical protein [Gammaproteobacteria bacterium]MDE0479422.1 hypothetical protein [Gammaproteobacteria bacterium]MDE0508888.1 hypothetical protein [Gammaproteobacteria bacterium]